MYFLDRLIIGDNAEFQGGGVRPSPFLDEPPISTNTLFQNDWNFLTPSPSARSVAGQSAFALHSMFCKGSVGRILSLFLFMFLISNILIFCKIAAQRASPNFHPEKYHIQCGYFSSLKKKVPKRDQKGTTFFEKGDQDGTCSCQKRDSFAQSRFKDHILFE